MITDMNFFSALLEEKRKEKHRRLLTIFIPALVLLIIIAVFAVNEARILWLTKSNNELNSYLKSNEVSNERQDISNKTKQQDILDKYDKILENAENGVNSQDKVKSAVIEKINSVIPRNIVFQTVQFTAQNFTITAKAPGNTAAAEFLHNLEATGDFVNLHIATIESSTGNTEEKTFTISGDLKDVKK
jgi:Tfp pilus assembly protein PilN